MKRLKFSCPFGGKNYPLALTFGLTFFPILLAADKGLPIPALILLMILIPIAVLSICFLIEQRLTDGEKLIIEESEMPFWEMAPKDLQEAVRRRSQPVNTNLLITCGMLFAFSMPAIGGTGHFGYLFIIASIMALVIIVDNIRRKQWREIDDTALCITVPIHHMYDVVRQGRYGNGFTESYIVFYLPDGRYTLKAKRGSGYASSVTIVQFRGMYLWLPYFD